MRAKRRIQIVDSDRNNQESLKDMLSTLDVEVEATSSSDETEKVAKRFQPSHLIINWRLEDGQSAVDTFRIIQKSLPDLKAILVAEDRGDYSLSTPQHVASLNSMGFLSLPIKPSKLHELIGNLK